MQLDFRESGRLMAKLLFMGGLLGALHLAHAGRDAEQIDIQSRAYKEVLRERVNRTPSDPESRHSADTRPIAHGPREEPVPGWHPAPSHAAPLPPGGDTATPVTRPAQ